MADPTRVERVFLDALNKADADRPAFLAEACGADPGLRREVERLLAAQPHLGRFLDDPVGEGLPPTEEQRVPSVAVGAVLAGRYKLVEPVGEGGMGAVWMAQQTEPVKRLVAVKLIKAGMDSRQVIARFEAERQALALMDHPNIARVLDAGTTPAGRPYFVMDLVKGLPITRYCDEHHLTPRQRLELFVPVCRAVQHAHQKGVIHRDLKPSNVLVAQYDGRPVPKVIDFGVAKAAGQPLTDKTLVTGFGNIVGTLEYMSPEQAEVNQLDIDTRSDIYSLGVLLYELLAGSPPFTKRELETAGVLEMLRVIREQEPSRPSAKLSTAEGLPTLAENRGTEPGKLAKLVRGELDWIVMKALEKDRGRRYETATGFAMDVQRYLADEPVLAGPPSAGYRLRKLVRRNRGPVLAASLVFLALVGGIAGTTWGMIRATRAEGQALGESGDKDRAIAARDRAIETLGDEQRQARVTFTNFLVDRGLAVCEEGDVGLGLLWLGRALETVPPDAADLQRVIRMNLAAWGRETCQLKAVWQGDHGIRDAVFGADGKTVMVVTWTPSGPAKSEVLLIDPASGEPVRAPVVVDGECMGCRATPDGRLLACMTAQDGGVSTARVWDAAAGKPVGPALAAPGLGRVQFSVDGRVVAGGNVQTVVWDPGSGKAMGGRIDGRFLALSPDGGRVATLTGSKTAAVQVWDTAAGTPAGPPLSDPVAPPDRWEAHRASFGPGGNTLLLAYRKIASNQPDNRPLEYLGQVWDVSAGKPLGRPVALAEGGGDLVHSPDGQSVASFGQHDGKAQVWRPQYRGGGTPFTWGAPRVLPHPRGVVHLEFGPDRLMLTGDWEKARLWTEDGSPLGSPWPTGGSPKPVFHPDGRSVMTTSGASARPGSLRLWEIPGGGAPAGLGEMSLGGFLQKQGAGFPRLEGLAVAPDGRTVLTAAYDKTAWRVGPAKLFLQRLDLAGKRIGPPLVLDAGPAAFSADGTAAVTVAYQWRPDSPGNPVGKPPVAESRVQLWETGTWKPVGPPLRHPGYIGAVLMGRDSRVVLIVDHSDPKADRTLRLLDTTTWQPLGPAWPAPCDLGPGASPLGLALSPDGKRVLTPAGNHGRVRDAATGTPVGPTLEHQGLIRDAAFSPDGRTLVTAGDDQAARLWDVPDGRPLGPPLRHPAGVAAVTFSPDGRTVVTATAEDAARFWDVATLKPLGPPLRCAAPLRVQQTERGFTFHSGVALSFYPDGRQVLTAIRAGYIRCWEGPRPPLQGSVERLATWTKTVSGRELDASGVGGWQSADTWKRHRHRLQELGGPPGATGKAGE